VEFDPALTLLGFLFETGVYPELQKVHPFGVVENKSATFVPINLTIGLFSNGRWSANPHGISFPSVREMNLALVSWQQGFAQ